VIAMTDEQNCGNIDVLLGSIEKVANNLESLDDKVQGMDSKLVRIEERCSYKCQASDVMHQEIYGNGQDGLKADVRVLKDSKKLQDNIIIGIIVGLVLTFGSSILALVNIQNDTPHVHTESTE
jgi:hypothetical protein